MRSSHVSAGRDFDLQTHPWSSPRSIVACSCQGSPCVGTAPSPCDETWSRSCFVSVGYSSPRLGPVRIRPVSLRDMRPASQRVPVFVRCSYQGSPLRRESSLQHAAPRLLSALRRLATGRAGPCGLPAVFRLPSTPTEPPGVPSWPLGGRVHHRLGRSVVRRCAVCLRPLPQPYAMASAAYCNEDSPLGKNPGGNIAVRVSAQSASRRVSLYSHQNHSRSRLWWPSYGQSPRLLTRAWMNCDITVCRGQSLSALPKC